MFNAQCQYLDHIAAVEIPKVTMNVEERQEKESFRLRLESCCQEALKTEHADDADQVSLQSYGSFSSGFAMQGSDMDLAIVPLAAPSVESLPFGRDLPRLLEKCFLDNGFGARLLIRTRVPILKVCEKPTPELFAALRKERQRWDDLPEDEKYPVFVPTTEDATVGAEPPAEEDATDHDPTKAQKQDSPDRPQDGNQGGPEGESQGRIKDATQHEVPDRAQDGTQAVQQDDPAKQPSTEGPHTAKPRAPQRSWLREKALGPLDFPKSGVGIQCDINFSNPLAFHNTLLLRCYSHCDPRVRPMVLFVKAWAKRRLINSARNGTLSSYGYVLMVLHFLVNIARPPVLPNLQLPVQGVWTPEPQQGTGVDRYDVRFWRDEEQIKRLAAQGRITANREPLGVLLRNFFNYYAAQGPNVISSGFNWSAEALSLRTQGGIRTKASKGWTGAKTVTVDNREVRHRYLFAIEDPFELDHNVARTVVHFGIVAIRDELRRAWRILNAVGRGERPEGELFAAVETNPPLASGVEAARVESANAVPGENRAARPTKTATAQAAEMLALPVGREGADGVASREAATVNVPG